MKTLKTLFAILLLTVLCVFNISIASAADGGVSAYVNVLRNNNGLPTLPEKAELVEAAQAKADELAAADTGGLSYPDKSGFPQYTFSIVGQKYSVSEVVNQQWAVTADQRANMLNPKVTHIGSGSKAGKSGKVYAVTLLSRYPTAESAPVPAPAPVANNPAPVVQEPAPAPAVVEASAPVVQAPAPVVAPAPAVQAPAPVVQPAPEATTKESQAPTPTATPSPSASMSATPEAKPTAEPTETPKDPDVLKAESATDVVGATEIVKPILGAGGVVSYLLLIPLGVRARRKKKESIA